ncbi:MAG: PfkB family carbohydrate kinase [Pseudorhodoplanes sp.]
MASLPDTAGSKLIVCAGMAVIDHVYRLATFPVPGTKTRAQDFFSVLGGCAANAAVAIRRLGGQARVVSPLGGPAGRDLTGDNILAKLQHEKIDVAHVVRVEGAVSSRSSIFIDGHGERTIVSYRDPALEQARPNDPVRAIAGADGILVDNRFPEFVLPIVRAAVAEGKVIVLDGDKPMDMTDELLTLPTHIVFSADGLRATAQTDDLATALTIVRRHTAALVAVTQGAQDMLWLEQGSLRCLPAFRIDAVDTLGAGDVFHGAFALALAEGYGVAASIRFAAAAAAIKCSRVGGGNAAPYRGELEDFLLDRPERD